MLLKDFITASIATLTEGMSQNEARASVLGLCEHSLGTKSYTHVIYPDFEVPEDSLQWLESAVKRLKANEPLQYIVGQQEFCGRLFNVSPSVLIPRPETEQMVMSLIDMLSERYSGDYSSLRILDLCTGSGCIAWTLALSLPGAKVTGVDISDEALKVAASQPVASVNNEISASGQHSVLHSGQEFGLHSGLDSSMKNGCYSPEFVKYDVLSGPDSFEYGDFDVIVSNPPYVMNKEKSLMHENVLNYEPHLALFVEDDDPLIFYRAIADFAGKRLMPGGIGLLEINEALGGPTAAIFENLNFEKIEILKDFRTKFRFISFQKPL